MTFCPCGSQRTYEQCCGLFIEKKQSPQTPEQLMRSRYTAYSQANIEYIKNTMAGKALTGFNESEAQKWAKRVIWIGLKVISTAQESPEKGFVEFSAHFLEGDQLKTIQELSEFHFKNNIWLYVDGVNKGTTGRQGQKIPRNDPCPCGSGKKFKNCHNRER